jgi:(p)ppGpp synthase/HD superfamily hydrolase
MFVIKPLSSRFEEALVHVAQLHARQGRKGSRIPYLAHLLGVASIVLQYGGKEDEAIAALLHDAVEDQGGKAMREEIRAKYGEKVATIVDGCTDSDTFPKPPWRQRKEQYIAHIFEASSSVLLVSAADKLENARAILKDHRAIGNRVWLRFKGRKDGSLWYYRQMVNAYRSAKNLSRDKRVGPLVAELDRVVMEIERRSGLGSPYAV